jgi:hypothetical protein
MDGKPTGHPTTALDTACTLYLADTSDHETQPHRPLTDVRGAALGSLRALSAQLFSGV